MKVEIADYKLEYDENLLALFYQSNFFNKKEFDYIRIPEKWSYRYEIFEEYIIKVALVQNEVVASLGLIIRQGFVDGNKIKIGCFVDNCILPRYYNSHDEVFTKLFKRIEKEALEKNVKIIQGWDFLININKNWGMFKNQGYIKLEGVNWLSCGINTQGNFPGKWKLKISPFWEWFFKLFRFYNIVFSKFIKKLPDSIEIRQMTSQDIEMVHKFLIKHRSENFSPFESPQDFKGLFKKNILKGVVAVENSNVVGVVTYVLVGWGGWMFKKPFYDVNPKSFFGFTPNEFVVKPEYQDTSLPSHMILTLMKQKISGGGKTHFNFIATVFDGRATWKRKAFKKLGFTEPKFDYGAIVAKSLDKNLKINHKNIWALPVIYIISPVPWG